MYLFNTIIDLQPYPVHLKGSRPHKMSEENSESSSGTDSSIDGSFMGQFDFQNAFDYASKVIS